MIAVEKLALRQGTFVIENLSFEVPTGRYGVLMGRTGCGKTSLLECIAGLRRPSAGKVRLNGIDVTNAAPGARGIGYLPQDGALFGSMTVREHLTFALELRRESRAAILHRVAELAEWLKIGALLDRRPQGLSGGEAQRVALGRALSFRPGVLLFDEPLSSLDESTREEIIPLLKRLCVHEHATVLHVTHSRHEAEQLGDVVFRFEHGVISTVDSAHSS